MNAIELTHVCKTFPGFAIQDLSLAVPSGTICGLVGENGAGKTTAIRLMLGALRPDSGRCTLLGVDTDSPQILAAKEDVGVVLDEAYFPETLNAVQVGKILSKTYRRWDKDRYDGYLDRFSLPRDKQFKDFSRGMKMKLAIATALAHDPKLLVLDEATAGLDPIVRDEVLELFNEFTREEDHSILISSHILFCTRGSSFSAMRRTAFWRNTPSLPAQRSRPTASAVRRWWAGSPADWAGHGAWSGAAKSLPHWSWSGPPWRTSFSFW